MVTGFKPYRVFDTFTQITWVYAPRYKHATTFPKSEGFVSLLSTAGHKVSARTNSH